MTRFFVMATVLVTVTAMAALRDVEREAERSVERAVMIEGERHVIREGPAARVAGTLDYTFEDFECWPGGDYYYVDFALGDTVCHLAPWHGEEFEVGKAPAESFGERSILTGGSYGGGEVLLYCDAEPVSIFAAMTPTVYGEKPVMYCWSTWARFGNYAYAVDLGQYNFQEPGRVYQGSVTHWGGYAVCAMTGGAFDRIGIVLEKTE